MSKHCTCIPQHRQHIINGQVVCDVCNRPLPTPPSRPEQEAARAAGKWRVTRYGFPIAMQQGKSVAMIEVAELDAMLAAYAAHLRQLHDKEVAALKEALGNLLTKLDAIEQHPMFGAVFTIAHIHGTTYDGPNWKDEYDAARTLLEAERKLRGEE